MENKMDVMMYSSENDNLLQRLLDAVAHAGLSEQAVLYKSIDDFIQGLYQPRGNMHVAILMLRTSQEIEHLSREQYLMSDIKVILILPRQDNGLKDMCRVLHARLTLNEAENFAPISEVLMKLNRQYGNNDMHQLFTGDGERE